MGSRKRDSKSPEAHELESPKKQTPVQEIEMQISPEIRHSNSLSTTASSLMEQCSEESVHDALKSL